MNRLKFYEEDWDIEENFDIVEGDKVEVLIDSFILIKDQ